MRIRFGMIVSGVMLATGLVTVTAAQERPLPLTVKGVEEQEVGLGQPLTVAVDGLGEWLKTEASKNVKFVVYLNGRVVEDKDRKPASKDNTLRFDLRRTPESRDTWTALLGHPDRFVRPVQVRVGVANGPLLAGEATTNLIVVREWRFWIFAVLLAAVALLFLWLARVSNILRDSGAQLPAGQRRQYSLARTQMSFWFFLVLASYVLIWLITGDRDTITESVLGLIGISAGTALGAAIIDANKPGAQVAGASAPPAPAPPAAGGTPPVAPPVSTGFLTDLISDSGGVSLHRFQIAVWTLVLGVIFVSSVFNSLSMPEFSGTLLGLMGISAGTYIGFKVPETKAQRQ